MIVLPAIDIRAGKCVRLTQGDYGREKIYDLDPVAVAEGFRTEGAEWIHVVDLDAAKVGSPVNVDIVAAIVRETGLPVEYGGGVRSIDSAAKMLDLGVARVVVGTKLVSDRTLAQELFKTFTTRLVAGLDARDGKVSISGWIEDSSLDVIDFAKEMESIGAQRIVVTDISRDGMLTGPNLELLRRMLEAVRIPIVQSGGIASLDDVSAVKNVGAEGVIIGKAIYEGNLTVANAVAVSR